MTSSLSGRRVLAILVGFFGVIAITNVLFTVEAVKTFRGEDEQEPYLQGIGYNATIEKRVQQAALGWSATLSAERDRSGHVLLEVAMRDRNGRPVEHLSLSTRLRHPVDAARDHVIALTETAGGVYTGSARKVDSGAWDIEIDLASPKNIAFQAERRVWLH